MAVSSCHQNPFLQEWDTPYGIPPYDEIRVADYMPAIKAGIEVQQKTIDRIVASKEAPTFDNTVKPFELSGLLLSKVSGVLFNISESDRTDELDAVVEEALPLLSNHDDNISFNEGLYRKIAAIRDGGMDDLDAEQRMVVEELYRGFIRNGIALDDEAKEEMRRINSELASKTQKIGNNILAESNAFKERFGISVSQYTDEMTNCPDRERRRQMFEAYSSRGHNGGENDNRELALDVFKLRLRKAQLLGYRNFAEYQLSDKMAGKTETVDAFLDGIMKAAVKKAKEEVEAMQAIAPEPIEPWDWWYYSEKVRKAKYDLDEELTKPYFQIDSVVKGIFYADEYLYGVHMEKIVGVPAYNSEVVTTYKVSDSDGSLLGIFTTDYHPRSSKRGGAWMNNVREQYFDAEGNEVRPIILNVANLPEKLSVDDVLTVFHEFGHALHGLLTKCHYPSVSGTNVTRDFVEMFSQFNENWAFQPMFLSAYANHCETGEPIPAELVAKIGNSLKFNQGFMTTELCAASILDMKWHELESFDGIDIDSFEAKVNSEIGLIPQIAPRYRTTYFNHIFSSGYCAGYYGYLWAEVLDKDAFSIFEKSCRNADGTWDEDKTKRMAGLFRRTFLEKGGSVEPMTLYKTFAGREPDPSALIKARGL